MSYQMTKSCLFAAGLVLALCVSPWAEAQEASRPSVNCQITGSGSERLLRLELRGGAVPAGDLSVLVIGKGATGYRRLGLVPMGARSGEAAVTELPLLELGGGDVLSCSATVVASRQRPRPAVALSASFETRAPPPPVDAHQDARDNVRHLGGPVLGFGLGIGVAILGAGIGSSFDARDSFIGAGTVLGGYLGFALGTGLGTAWVWNAGETEGALSGALAGGLIGGALGIGTAVLTQSEASLFLLLAGPGVGAWIGAATTHRHPKGSEEPGHSLLVRDSEGLSLGIPRLQLSPKASGIGASVSLFEGRW